MDHREPLEGFPAPLWRHVEIEQSDIYVAFPEALYRLATVPCDDYLEALRSKRALNAASTAASSSASSIFAFMFVRLILKASAVPKG